MASSSPAPAAGAPTARDTHKTPAPPMPPERLGARTLALMIAGLTLFVYVVHTHLPPNAVVLPHEDGLRQPIQLVLPQGWAFFTRSPREPDLLPMVRAGDGGWQPALRAPHAEPRNALGLDRASRAQGVELGLLTGGLAEDAWQDCTGTVTACLEAAPVRAMVNPAPAPTLCGDIALVRQAPVPWAWSRSATEVTMPSTVTRLDVTC